MIQRFEVHNDDTQMTQDSSKFLDPFSVLFACPLPKKLFVWTHTYNSNTLPWLSVFPSALCGVFLWVCC